MKVVQPDATVIARDDSKPLEFIERIGRTCYKSEDKITDGSAVKFCNDLKNRKHYAMMEHLPIHMVLGVPYREFWEEMGDFACMARVDSQNDLMKYMHVSSFGGEREMYLTASLRVFLEIADQHSYRDTPRLVDEIMSAVANKFPMLFNAEQWSFRRTEDVEILGWDEFKEHMGVTAKCNGFPDCRIDGELEKHDFITAHLTCDRGVSHEIVRHRPCSFAQESTRYCNYSKGKFGGEITVIRPFYLEDGTRAFARWRDSCEVAERAYFTLLEFGCSPQEARAVLPNSLKTEIIVTANEAEWQHIMNLRYVGTTGAPHPQMKQVMNILYPQIADATEGRVGV